MARTFGARPIRLAHDVVTVILSQPAVDIDELAARTGWVLKAEGLCRDDICVPLPGHMGPSLDARLLEQRLGMPLVSEPAAGLWALGPESGRRPASAAAPDFTLPDWRGGDFTLSSLRGRKVLILAWAPW